MMIDKMREALSALNCPVYDPGQYEGKCKVPYLVIRNAGSQPSPGTRLQGHTQIDVMEYVPISEHSALDALHARVLNALSAISDCRWPGGVSPDSIESDYGAYSRTVSYFIPTTFD